MKVTLISDSHGMHNRILINKCDLLISAGDISMRGSIDEIKNFIEWFSNQNANYKVFIAGNHDFGLETKSKEISDILKKLPNNTFYLQDSSIRLNNIHIYGSPQTPRFKNWAFNVDRGESIKRYWDNIPEDVDILITHGPPYGIADFTYYDQKSVGCEELVKRIDLIKPKLHVFGHIHEEYQILLIDGIYYINTSICTRLYDPINNPILLDINEITKEITIL